MLPKLPDVKPGDKPGNIPGFPNATIVHPMGTIPFPEKDISPPWNTHISWSPTFGNVLGQKYNQEQHPIDVIGGTIIGNDDGICGLCTNYIGTQSECPGSGSGEAKAFSLGRDEYIIGFRGDSLFYFSLSRF
jgi:hypothetical protein